MSEFLPYVNYCSFNYGIASVQYPATYDSII